MTISPSTCAIVLAGGRSTRFGSDKSLAILRGKPLLAHVLRACAARFPRVFLVAKDPARYGSFCGDANLVRDRAAVSTPLAGIEAGLAITPADVAFCCAGDMPFAVDPALLDALFAALEGHDAAVPVNDGHLQPLCALYRREPCLAAASAALAAGPVGPRRLLDAVNTAQVPWADQKPVLDADTREDLARIATL
jgi:molybdopterin-guanine dinucleotide biosynthesis protein A